MKFLFELLALCMLSWANGEEIPRLRDNCLPCTAYGFNFCMDDDNLINLNADRCYSTQADKQQFCSGFDLIKNSLLCDTYNLTISDQCEKLFSGQNMLYNKPWRGNITLEPWSSCGWYIYQYSGFLDITWDWPLVFYHRDYKTVKFYDTEYVVTQSDPNGRFPGNECWNSTCNQNYYVTYGKQYFYIANFDRQNSATASFEILDLSAKFLKATALGLAAAAISLL